MYSKITTFEGESQYYLLTSLFLFLSLPRNDGVGFFESARCTQTASGGMPREHSRSDRPFSYCLGRVHTAGEPE